VIAEVVVVESEPFVGLPEHTTFQPGGTVNHWDDVLCNRCEEPATHSFGDTFDLCDDCVEDFRRWLK